MLRVLSEFMSENHRPVVNLSVTSGHRGRGGISGSSLNEHSCVEGWMASGNEKYR